MTSTLMAPGARPANPDTTTTRRTVLTAALALPAAAITILPGDALSAPATDEADEPSPLADFAVAWLSRWTQKGGSVTIGPDGKMWIGFPSYDYSAAYRPIAADLPEPVQHSRRAFDSAFYDGQMRELEQLLDLMAGGKQAVRECVTLFPVLGVTCFADAR